MLKFPVQSETTFPLGLKELTGEKTNPRPATVLPIHNLNRIKLQVICLDRPTNFS